MCSNAVRCSRGALFRYIMEHARLAPEPLRNDSNESTVAIKLAVFGAIAHNYDL